MTRPCPSKARRTRRGFTLLEVTLASAISAAVAGLCLSLFLFFDRTDARLEDRFLQNQQLSRLHLVSERAFSKLLMSDKPQVLREAEQRLLGAEASSPALGADGLPTIPAGGGGSGARASGGRQNRRDVQQHPEILAIKESIPPRLELAVDRAGRIEAPTNREAEGDTRSIRAQRFTTTPQRLELVLTESPVPSSSALDDPEALMERVARQRARERRDLRRMQSKSDREGATARERADDAQDEDAGLDDESDLESPMRALRGAFELRPMIANGKSGESVSGEARGWEVWWVPLPAEEGPGEELDLDAPEPEEPFLVAHDIAYIEWKVFQGRERRTQYAARLNEEIPAYIELEAETVSGLRANWLFEVDWTMGNESPPVEPVVPVAGTPGQPGQPVAPGANPGKPGEPVAPGSPAPGAPAPVDKPDASKPSPVPARPHVDKPEATEPPQGPRQRQLKPLEGDSIGPGTTPGGRIRGKPRGGR
jgi:prepilin-type N-terminal cleavage/methylation domain-containing protein